MKKQKECENCKWLENKWMWNCLCPKGQKNMTEICCDNWESEIEN